jgi:hypothetical protein
VLGGGFLWAAACATVLVQTVVLLHPPAVALMQPDSAGYLGFAADRTAGYPVFLRLVERLPGGLDNLPLLQCALYGLGAVALSNAFKRLSGSFVAALLLLALLLGNPQITRLSFMVMTEPLFLALLMALLALCCRLVRAPDAPRLAAVSALIGGAVLIRPAGYALLAALPVLAWWSASDGVSRKAVAAAALLPVAIMLGLGMAAYHAEHGLWRTQSFLGRLLIGKAAAIVPLRGRPRDRQIAALVAAVAADRAVIDRAPTLPDRFRLLVPYYDFWRFGPAAEAVAKQIPAAARNPAALDRAMARLSWAVITAAPAAYLGDLALNYAALWSLPDAMTGSELMHFRAFVAAHEPLPGLGRYPPWHRARNAVVVWGLRLFMATAFAASLGWSLRLVAGAWWRRRLPPLARLGFVAALVVQASFGLTAAVEAGLPRYVWAMWPGLAVLFVSVLLVGGQAWQRAQNRARARFGPPPPGRRYNGATA